MYAKLAGSLLGLFAIVSTANAATLISNDDGIKFTVSAGGKSGTALVNFNNLALLTGSTSTSSTTNLSLPVGTLGLTDAQVVKGNSSGYYAAPYGDTSKYVSVYSGGSAAFTLTQPANYFGFKWGSVDGYNAVTLTLTDGSALSYSGNSILDKITFSAGDQGADGTYYANFRTTGSALIKSVVLSSSGNSFEFDNVRVSAVPIPGALLLFGSALTGLGVVARKARRRIG